MLRWTGDPGDRYGDVCVERPLCAERHGPCGMFRHHRPTWHLEEVVLGFAGVGDERTSEDIAGTRYGCEPATNHTAGQGLCCCQRQATGAQHIEHCRFHVLLIDPEHNVTEQRADEALFLVENGCHLSRVGGLGADAYLDALDAAGLKGQQRVASFIEGLDALCKDFGERRLGFAPGPQHPTLDDCFHACASF